MSLGHNENDHFWGGGNAKISENSPPSDRTDGRTDGDGTRILCTPPLRHTHPHIITSHQEKELCFANFPFGVRLRPTPSLQQIEARFQIPQSSWVGPRLELLTRCFELLIRCFRLLTKCFELPNGCFSLLQPGKYLSGLLVKEVDYFSRVSKPAKNIIRLPARVTFFKRVFSPFSLLLQEKCLAELLFKGLQKRFSG